MKKIFIHILLLISLFVYAEAKDSFAALLAKCSVSFTFPKSFLPLGVRQNGDVEYDFAMKSKTDDIEIRYAIWSFDQMQQRNDLYIGLLQTMSLNISGGKLAQANHFKHEDVTIEFNADDGLTCVVPNNSEFGQGYKFCMINVIHKENIGDVYIFFLYDDYKVLFPFLLDDKVFHALKFK